MTRNEFILLALRISESKPALLDGSQRARDLHTARMNGWLKAVTAVIAMCKANNATFNEGTFRKACGI